MRLKTYTGRSMADVMTRLRKELGPDALILRTENGEAKGSVRVTAAYENKPGPAGPAKAANRPAKAPRTMLNSWLEEVAEVLAFHRLPAPLAERIRSVAAKGDEARAETAIAQAFGTLYHFRGLCAAGERPVMLIGPPGAGKTVTIAKLAAEARLDGLETNILTVDTVKSSGIEQLDHFARLMKLEVTVAATPDELALTLQDFDQPAERLTLVDTPGLNLNDADDHTLIAGFIDATDADVVLVLPAGLDAEESADAARGAAKLGAKGLIGTRLDAARRFGGLIAAADAGPLDFCGFGASPYVADLIEPPYPAELARRLTEFAAGCVDAPLEERIA